MELLTEQFFERQDNFKDKKRQRVYLKDIDCPPEWTEKLSQHLPQFLFYLNENTGGMDTVEDSSSARRSGKSIAIAGDLMSCLPEEMRAENLMCYVGHEGTYTPAHREMCATLGHNIMVEASGTIGDNNKRERPGSSIWFMTEANDRHLVAEYWLSVLGHDIEVEDHFAQINAWKKAPFTTYVVEQKPGDFILIPPLAHHQVWNRGTRTIKIAWNRTTTETLELAFREALPNARLVCRDEQYKNKAIVYYTLAKYSNLLRMAKRAVETDADQGRGVRSSKKFRDLQKHFIRLFMIFKDILMSEMFTPDAHHREPCEFIEFDSNVTCAYCRGNIFNRFLTCKSCPFQLGTETEEPYDVCMDCFAMGRSCACQSKFKWVEQWQWQFLTHNYEEWRKQILDIDAKIIKAVGVTLPNTLAEERKQLSKKTLAQICQEQLKLRPWNDVKAPAKTNDSEASEEEIEVDDNGTLKKTKKKKSKGWLKKHKTCHVCCHRHPSWKMASCTTCTKWWCYGSLYRAHDILPQTVMENPEWKCPHCLKVCNTGKCRQDPAQQSYEPKGTLLGHDTRKVADVRSIESLVDFGVSNLSWLREDIGLPLTQSSRFTRRAIEAAQARQDAEMAAAVEGGDGLLHDDHGHEDRIEYSPVEQDPGSQEPGFDTLANSLLDPALRDDGGAGHVEQNQPGFRPSNGGRSGFSPVNGSSSHISQQSSIDQAADQGENGIRLVQSGRGKQSKDGASDPSKPKPKPRARKRKNSNADDPSVTSKPRKARAPAKRSKAAKNNDGAVDSMPSKETSARDASLAQLLIAEIHRPEHPYDQLDGQTPSNSHHFRNDDDGDFPTMDKIVNNATQMLDSLPWNDNGYGYGGVMEMAESAMAALGQDDSHRPYQAA